MSACQGTRPTRRCQPHFSLAPRRFVDARGLIAPAWRQDEPVASFQACAHCPPWPWSRPRAVVACGAVSKGRGTLRQPVGCNAHEDGMLCACTPAMDKVPQHAFAPHIARGSTAHQHSQPGIRHMARPPLQPHPAMGVASSPWGCLTADPLTPCPGLEEDRDGTRPVSYTHLTLPTKRIV